VTERYTASASLARVKLKGWVSSSGSLSDAEIMSELNDALRTDVVAFLKSVRDEWFVDGTESVTPDSDGHIVMPNSVASTLRTVSWNNNGRFVPLPRIEPENALGYLNTGAGVPCGYVLRGYGLQILPNNVGSVTIRLEFMDRPADMVLEEDAGEVESQTGTALTLVSVPLAWQDETPGDVDIVSAESPFSTVINPLHASWPVASLVGNVLTLGSDPTNFIDGDIWITDVGSNPYPNIPVEFHPLLQQYVICTLGGALGDKRLDGWTKRLGQLEAKLRSLMAPRVTGSGRPILNPNAPGMNFARNWWGG